MHPAKVVSPTIRRFLSTDQLRLRRSPLSTPLPARPPPTSPIVSPSRTRSSCHLAKRHAGISLGGSRRTNTSLPVDSTRSWTRIQGEGQQTVGLSTGYPYYLGPEVLPPKSMSVSSCSSSPAWPRPSRSSAPRSISPRHFLRRVDLLILEASISWRSSRRAPASAKRPISVRS